MKLMMSKMVGKTSSLVIMDTEAEAGIEETLTSKEKGLEVTPGKDSDPNPSIEAVQDQETTAKEESSRRMDKGNHSTRMEEGSHQREHIK